MLSKSGHQHRALTTNFSLSYQKSLLVPYNVPKPALDLVSRFLGGESFADADLPVYPGVGVGPKAAVETVASAGSIADENNGKGGNNAAIGILCFVGGVVCSLLVGKFILHKKQQRTYNEIPSIPPSPGMGNVQIG